MTPALPTPSAAAPAARYAALLRVVRLPLRTLFVPTREDLRDWRSAARVARARIARRRRPS